MRTQFPEQPYGYPAGNVFSLDAARRRKQALQADRDETRAEALLAGVQAGRLPLIDLVGALIRPFNAELREADLHAAEVRRLADGRQ